MDPETNMSSMGHLDERHLEMITRCMQFQKLVKNLKKGVLVTCSLCKNSTPTDHRTNHIKHFLYNHLTEYDDKETVFKLLELNACKTYNVCWDRGIARAAEKKIGNVSKRKLETEPVSSTTGLTDPDHGDSLRNHQSYKKRWISQHHADTNDPGSSDEKKVARVKERIPHPKKSVSVYPHLSSCDSSKKSSNKSRKISSHPRKLDPSEGMKYSINGTAPRYQAYNSSSSVSTRDSRSLATASSHLSYSSQGLVGAVNIKGTKNYDEEIACMVLLQLASAECILNEKYQNNSTTDTSSGGNCSDTPTPMVSEKTKISSIKPPCSPVPQIPVNSESTSTTDTSSLDGSLQPEGVKASQYSQGLVETKKTFAPVVSNSPLCHNTLNTSSLHARTSAFTSVQVARKTSSAAKLNDPEVSRSSPCAQTSAGKAENGRMPQDRNGDKVKTIHEKCILKVHVSPNHVSLVHETSSSTSIKKETESSHDTYPTETTSTKNSNGSMQTAKSAPVKNSHEPNVVELTLDESMSVKRETKYAEHLAPECTQDNYASLNAPKTIIPMIYPTLPSTSTQSNSITSNSSSSPSSSSSSPPPPLQTTVSDERSLPIKVEPETPPNTSPLPSNGIIRSSCNDASDFHSGEQCCTLSESSDIDRKSLKVSPNKENHEETNSSTSVVPVSCDSHSKRETMQAESDSDSKDVTSSEEMAPQEANLKPELNICERSLRLKVVLSRLTKENGLPCPLCNDASTVTDRSNAHVEHFLLCHLNRDDDKETVFKSLGLSDSIKYNEFWKAGMGRLGVRSDSPCDVSHHENSSKTYPNATHESIVLGASFTNKRPPSSQASPPVKRRKVDMNEASCN